MYAIAAIQGKQYKIEQGKFIDISHIQGSKDGDRFEITDILLANKGGDLVLVGTPTIAGAKATATVKTALTKGDKVLTVKYKRRKDNRTIRGYRDQITRITIDTITLP